MHIDISAMVLTVAGLAINACWSALNLKVLASFRDTIRQEFPSRVECDGKHALTDERHAELCRRLDHAGA